jgi:GGDEF domain-containing protein
MSRMQPVVIGFWGWYFGMTALMLAVSSFAYRKNLRLISVKAAGATIASAVFTATCLGWISLSDAEYDARLLASLTCAVGSYLAYLLLILLGLLRHPPVKRVAVAALTTLAIAMMLIGFLLPAVQAQSLGLATASVLAFAELALSLRNAMRGDRLAWMVVVGVFSMSVAIFGLGWIATGRQTVSWPVHVISAIADTTYIVAMGVALWMRYAYLIELRQVMAMGPSYDPVTRMRSHSETGSMVTEIFKSYRKSPSPLGLIVVSIANLDVLEKLYGLAAVNQALFLLAGRLRREVPERVEMGRLGKESFLLLARNCSEGATLIALARSVQASLSRPLDLNMDPSSSPAAKKQTRWKAEAGTGVIRIYKSDAQAAYSVELGRGLSRSAWSFPSRVAWYDDGLGEIVGMPVLAG